MGFGFFLIVAWNVTGVLSFFIHDKWVFESPRVVLSSTLLFFFTLAGLKYLNNIFLYTLKQYVKALDSSFKSCYKKIWWFLFFLLIGNQLFWFVNEYLYLLHHPEVASLSYQRGANLGLPLLVYDFFVSTLLFVMFVDLITIGFIIFIFPFKIRNNVKISVFSIDKCGGNSKIGNLLLAYIKVYFLLLLIGTFGRFPGIDKPLFWYYLMFVVIAWFFGFFMFLTPMYPIKKQIKFLKLQKLTQIEEEIGNLSDNKLMCCTKRDVHNFILLKLKDDIRNIQENPIDIQMLKEFLFYSFLPLFSSIILNIIEKWGNVSKILLDIIQSDMGLILKHFIN